MTSRWWSSGGIIVEMGHGLFKKKEAEPLCLKSDSYVCESSVHFPTDYNLLWDSIRKCLDVIKWFGIHVFILEGWRKHYRWRRELKRLYRKVAQASRGGGKNKQKRLEEAVKEYLAKCEEFLAKLKETKIPAVNPLSHSEIRGT